MADALHSVSTVELQRLKETCVSDSFLGNGPEEAGNSKCKTTFKKQILAADTYFSLLT